MDWKIGKEYVKVVYCHRAYFTLKAKWLSEEALQIAEKRREAKGKGGKGKIYQSECRVPENSKER